MPVMAVIHPSSSTQSSSAPPGLPLGNQPRWNRPSREVMWTSARSSTTCVNTACANWSCTRIGWPGTEPPGAEPKARRSWRVQVAGHPLPRCHHSDQGFRGRSATLTCPCGFPPVLWRSFLSAPGELSVTIEPGRAASGMPRTTKRTRADGKPSALWSALPSAARPGDHQPPRVPMHVMHRLVARSRAFPPEAMTGLLSLIRLHSPGGGSRIQPHFGGCTSSSVM